MTVRLLFFSSLQDLVGAPEIERTLSADREWTLGALLETLYEEFPTLRDWDGRLLLAIDQVWADRGQVITDQAEIAIMPPVQGG